MHFMNPQRAAHLVPPAATKQRAPGAPQAGGMNDQQMDDQPEATVTLTKMPDGTVTCDGGDGTPQTYQSVDEALDAAQSILGGDEDLPGEEDQAQGGGDTGAMPGAGGQV